MNSSMRGLVAHPAPSVAQSIGRHRRVAIAVAAIAVVGGAGWWGSRLIGAEVTSPNASAPGHTVRIPVPAAPPVLPAGGAKWASHAQLRLAALDTDLSKIKHTKQVWNASPMAHRHGTPPAAVTDMLAQEQKLQHARDSLAQGLNSWHKLSKAHDAAVAAVTQLSHAGSRPVGPRMSSAPAPQVLVRHVKQESHTMSALMPAVHTAMTTPMPTVAGAVAPLTSAVLALTTPAPHKSISPRPTSKPAQVPPSAVAQPTPSGPSGDHAHAPSGSAVSAPTKPQGTTPVSPTSVAPNAPSPAPAPVLAPAPTQPSRVVSPSKPSVIVPGSSGITVHPAPVTVPDLTGGHAPVTVVPPTVAVPGTPPIAANVPPVSKVVPALPVLPVQVAPRLPVITVPRTGAVGSNGTPGVDGTTTGSAPAPVAPPRPSGPAAPPIAVPVVAPVRTQLTESASPALSMLGRLEALAVLARLHEQQQPYPARVVTSTSAGGPGEMPTTNTVGQRGSAVTAVDGQGVAGVGSPSTSRCPEQ
ncbi:MAG: hypothetical protein ACRDRL_25465 [Sciscionella sp.]